MKTLLPMKGKRGLGTFWPELEPRKTGGFCYVCRRGTKVGHESTRLHRLRTRPLDLRRGSGDWLAPFPTVLRDPYGEHRDWEQEARDLEEVST